MLFITPGSLRLAPITVMNCMMGGGTVLHNYCLFTIVVALCASNNIHVLTTRLIMRNAYSLSYYENLKPAPC